jgi:hypothetical protein
MVDGGIERKCRIVVTPKGISTCFLAGILIHGWLKPDFWMLDQNIPGIISDI